MLDFRVSPVAGAGFGVNMHQTEAKENGDDQECFDNQALKKILIRTFSAAVCFGKELGGGTSINNTINILKQHLNSYYMVKLPPPLTETLSH